MANEFIIKNGYFSQGSSNITGSLTVTGGITGSLFGTASWAQNAITASFITTAQTASYVLNAVSSSFATSSSFAITASNATGLSTLNQNVTISGSLTLTNDLIVLGSASVQYITSSQLNINDNIISVNTITPSVRFGGLAVIDSGSSPIQSGSLLFDSQNNQWIFVHQAAAGAAITSSMLLMGPQTFNNLGNETALTANRVPKASGADLGEHLTDSNIEDTGTAVSIAVGDAGYASNIITQPSVISTSVENIGTGFYSEIRYAYDQIGIRLYDASDINRGSVEVTNGLVRITGSLDVKSGITGSLFGTASWSRNATTASFINVTNTLNASDYYIVGIDSDNGAQNPEQLYNFGGLAFNPDDNTLKVANGAGTIIGNLTGTASYATKAQNGFPYTGSAQITGSLGVTGSLQITGSTTTDLVRITQTGTGNAFVVEDSSTLDATSFIIDASGSVGIGVSSINSDYKTNIYTNSSTQATTLYVQNQSNNFSNTGTAIFGNGLSAGVFGYANGNQNPIGVTGYASDGITVIGVSGVSGKSEFGSADTTIGGYFESTADYGGGSVGSYAVQLVDGTQGIGKVLVSQTSDGKANWSTKLSGSYEITGSLAISGSVIGQSGNTISSNALLQATLLYLSNNF